MSISLSSLSAVHLALTIELHKPCGVGCTSGFGCRKRCLQVSGLEHLRLAIALLWRKGEISVLEMRQRKGEREREKNALAYLSTNGRDAEEAKKQYNEHLSHFCS